MIGADLAVPLGALCAACGFREVGEYQRHAQLDGQWLDVVIVERLIAQSLANKHGQSQN